MAAHDRVKRERAPDSGSARSIEIQSMNLLLLPMLLKWMSGGGDGGRILSEEPRALQHANLCSKCARGPTQT